MRVSDLYFISDEFVIHICDDKKTREMPPIYPV